MRDLAPKGDKVLHYDRLCCTCKPAAQWLVEPLLVILATMPGELAILTPSCAGREEKEVI